MSIPVHRIKQLGDGSLEIMIHGNHAAAKYVIGRLNMEKGVSIAEPMSKHGMPGFMFLVARGTTANPFTHERAVQMLQDDQHIKLILNSDSPPNVDEAG